MDSELDEKENIFVDGNFSYSHLDSLVQFAKSKNLTAAAKKKGIDISNMSLHIKKLDQFFGCKLRQNTGKTAALSPDGRELVQLLRRQFKELEDFRDKRVKNLNSVDIVAGDSVLHLILLPRLQQLHLKYPKTKISVSASGTFNIIQELQNLSSDLGLLRESAIAGKKSIEYQELGLYRYAIFVPGPMCPSGNVDGEMLSVLPYATIKDHWDTDFTQIVSEDGIFFQNAQVFCENFTQVFRLVHRRAYVGILPRFCKKLLPVDTVCYDPPSLVNFEQKIVLAWNPSLMAIKEKLKPFADDLQEELEIAMFESQ